MCVCDIACHCALVCLCASIMYVYVVVRACDGVRMYCLHGLVCDRRFCVCVYICNSLYMWPTMSSFVLLVACLIGCALAFVYLCVASVDCMCVHVALRSNAYVSALWTM